jgi:diaminopimelate decarboxylase
MEGVVLHNWRRTMDNSTFHYHDSYLHADGVNLSEMSAIVGTPCYVYSRDRTLANLNRLRTAFLEAEIHYSLKANANLALIRMLIAAGADMDAVSGGEIFRALRAGTAPAQIVFAGVGKTEAELTYALDAGIGWFNVESSLELADLARLAKEMGKRPRIALRINPSIQADTHHYIATGHSAAKFGIPLKEAHALLDQYANSQHIGLEGLHVHIGSQLGTVDRTVEAINAVLPLFDKYPQLNTLNLGGGFPVSYNGEIVPSVEVFSEAVNACLKGRSLRLLLEPGRFIIADAGALIVRVQYIKPAPDGILAITDGGMTELIRPALYGATHHVMPLNEPSSDQHQQTQVVGPVCESADVLRADIMLSPLQPGDLLAIMHAGAYGAVMGSNYNARPRPPEILVEGAGWRVIRHRETWEDLIRLEE